MAKVVYIYSKELREQCDKLPMMRYRATRVQELISSYQLLPLEKLRIVKPERATDDELKKFHGSAYIEFIKSVNNMTDFCKCDPILMEKYGLIYDCPILNHLYDFICEIAGGTLTAAKLLVNGDAKIAINWYGGWHHAQRDEAEGFCYVNDIVIGIHKLMEKFDRILYLDLDVHHGNGVQNAFDYSKKVLTLSIHKSSPGFYPGTGLINDCGKENGEYYSINVPLLNGISDATYTNIFQEVFHRIYNAYQPSVIVVQCGGDILTGDPTGECNVSINAMAECIKTILNQDMPTIFLGGGGYNFPNTARYWALLTSIISDNQIENDIPDDSCFFTEYGPTYEIKIYPTTMKDLNTKDYLNFIIDKIEDYCDRIKHTIY